MRDKLLSAFKAHMEGQIAKSVANVEVLLNNTTGVADHPDMISTIGTEIELIAKYNDMLEMANKHF
jgi:hypothetical protein|tara:strand:- start:3376 stop:3573 length:198 start_codon:yes stop_codon:yes gene_type:complete